MKPLIHRRWFWRLITAEWLAVAIIFAWLKPVAGKSGYLLLIALLFAAISFLIQSSLPSQGDRQ